MQPLLQAWAEQSKETAAAGKLLYTLLLCSKKLSFQDQSLSPFPPCAMQMKTFTCRSQFARVDLAMALHSSSHLLQTLQALSCDLCLHATWNTGIELCLHATWNACIELCLHATGTPVKMVDNEKSDTEELFCGLDFHRHL